MDHSLPPDDPPIEDGDALARAFRRVTFAVAD